MNGRSPKCSKASRERLLRNRAWPAGAASQTLGTRRGSGRTVPRNRFWPGKGRQDVAFLQATLPRCPLNALRSKDLRTAHCARGGVLCLSAGKPSIRGLAARVWAFFRPLRWGRNPGGGAAFGRLRTTCCSETADGHSSCLFELRSQIHRGGQGGGAQEAGLSSMWLDVADPAAGADGQDGAQRVFGPAGRRFAGPGGAGAD